MKYAPIAEIDFTAPGTKRRKVRTWNQSFEQGVSIQKSLVPPTDKELSCFYEALSKTGKPALLSLLSKYSDSYIVDYSKLSMQLASLFDEKCLELPYNELLEKCEEAFDKIQVSTSQTRNIKTATQTQAQLKIWFIYRAGQVTASRFKSAVCTDMSQPSQSLIKTICYPHR